MTAAINGALSTVSPGANSSPPIELSIVMPCLNEADTLAVCISKARAAIAGMGDSAEIVIADNGSNDGSQKIATDLGARVVPVAEEGYGKTVKTAPAITNVTTTGGMIKCINPSNPPDDDRERESNRPR